METFDGLAVLATNLRANIDEAFTRRLDAIVDFPAPDRRAAPARCGSSASRRRCRSATTSTCDFCADVVRAVRRQHPVGRDHRRLPRRARPASGRRWTELIAAVEQEYRKLGRLVLEREFGDYLRGCSADRCRPRTLR